ncbi:MAG TPA: AraC family transcriptional regulator [Rhizomicrobium sp.]|jgi:AraC-like DNA-binding protein|nr:AraC family transcriptional regulator [Rhizomicrobium sp.]
MPTAQILASYFHTPGAVSQHLFHTVHRAGHLQSAPHDTVERLSYPGHDLLLCLSGKGSVRSHGKTFPLTIGQLAWIDCREPHGHWADANAPWELYWLRADGKQTRACAEALAVTEQPVFDLAGAKEAAAMFEHVFALLRERPLALDASLHAAMAGLIALLFQVRLAPPRPDPATADLKLPALLARVRRDYQRPWRVEELAALAGLSVPHFYRRFRKATGATPLDWLRRERVNEAKRRLSQSRDPIAAIAEQLGYGDQFYFSRDFKKLVGLSPRHYRQQEVENRR